jgi:transcriptional regulator with XRE-family HTH domain
LEPKADEPGPVAAGDPVQIDEARFAANIRARRESVGWSQGELARRLRENGWENFHQTTVSRIEKGDRPIRLGEAVAVAELLGVPIDKLLERTERMQALLVWEEAVAAIRRAFRNLLVARDEYESERRTLNVILEHPARVTLPQNVLDNATRAVKLTPAEAVALDLSDDLAHWLLSSPVTASRPTSWNVGGPGHGEHR